MSLDHKTKPRWIGPMIVVRQTKGGSYILAEMDGSVSKLRFAAFRVIPYHARKQLDIDPTTFFHNDDSEAADPALLDDGDRIDIEDGLAGIDAEDEGSLE